MNLPDDLQQALHVARARVRVGYPWWLRPWLASGIAGITLGRTIYLRAEGIASETTLARLLRHELAHVQQVNRLGVVTFLARYTGEFIRHLLNVRSFARAYAMISFEVEARAAERQSEP